MTLLLVDIKESIYIYPEIVHQMGFEILLVLAPFVRENKWKMSRKRKGVPKDGAVSTQSLQDAPNDDSSSTQSLEISKKQNTGVAQILSQIEEFGNKLQEFGNKLKTLTAQQTGT